MTFSFDEHYLEDGIAHPAEKILSAALAEAEEDSPAVLRWLAAVCGDKRQPILAASTLRCLGRLDDPGDLQWRCSLVRVGLASENPQVRDASVQAAEGWGGAGLADTLRNHDEEVPWLRDHVEGVIADAQR